VSEANKRHQEAAVKPTTPRFPDAHQVKGAKPMTAPTSPTPPDQSGGKPLPNGVRLIQPGAKPAGPPPNLPPLKPLASQNLAPKARPKLQTITQGDVGIVTILESRILDESNINEIGRQLMDLVTKQYMIKMVIDMGEVKYLSSAVLRQMIALYKAIKAEKGDLKICRVNKEVREVFTITQLDKMIEIKDDLASAVNAFKKQGGGFFKR
jgi:anti-anti-sigma factor